MREELVKRIIEAKEKSGKFASFKIICKQDTKLEEDILLYPGFNEYDDNLRVKAACILLGYKPVCLECGSDVTFKGQQVEKNINTIFGSFNRFCSAKCSSKSSIIKDKIKATNLERYGHENPFGSKEIIEQRKKNNLEKYGVENTASLKEVQDKMKLTSLERYGAENPFGSNEIQEKIKKTNLERYGVEYFKKSEKYKTVYRSYSFKRYLNNGVDNHFASLICAESNIELKELLEKTISIYNYQVKSDLSSHFGYSHQGMCRIIRDLGLSHHFPNRPNPKFISFSEQEIFEFVQSFNNIIHVQSDRTILEGKELDIYIPSHKLAIEFDGIYWHSINQGTSKDYHLEKTLKCESKGIQLLHIFEPEWEDPIKQEIWKSIIKAKLGIFDSVVYARKCSVKEVSSKEARLFLDKNHLQGFANGKTHLGLVYSGSLVSVLSYGKSRFKKDETEIIRFASLLNTRVQGGFSKLLKQIKCDNLVSFADRRYSSNLNNVYSKTMALDSISSPSFWVYEDGVLKHRLGYQKHLLQEKLENFDPSKTAMDNLLDNDKLVIYDCGNLKYKMK